MRLAALLAAALFSGAVFAQKETAIRFALDWRFEGPAAPFFVDSSAFAGVSRTGVITSDFDTLTARVGFVHDLSDAHGSYVITPQVNYTTPLSVRNLVSFGVSGDYVGKGYGRTYFGVTPGQTLASTLRTYTIGDSGWKSYSLSAFALQSLSGDLRRGLGIGAGVLYTGYLGRYKRSPLVRDIGDSSTWTLAAGLTDTF